MIFAASMLCIAAPTLAAPASPQITLAPYKDKLFGYPAVLQQNGDGSFRVIDYGEQRDINKRDEIPVARAHSWYVDTGVRSKEVRETVSVKGHDIPVDRTGAVVGARFAVIFIHGRGGDRRLGSNDWMFGGNFNRIKNLAVRNRGVYYAPSVKRFDAQGVADIAALIGYVASKAPRAKIVLACGSMGSIVCWRLARQQAAVGRLAGLMILGGASDRPYLASAAFKTGLPLFVAQGTDDRVYSWLDQKRLFERIRAARPGYPVHLVVFRTGTHGTPIRMTDWRQSLNWIFRVDASR